MPRIFHCLAAVALLILIPAGAAHAAPTAPELISSFDQVTMVPGAEPSTASASGYLAVREVPARTHRLTYDVDFSAVAAFTTVRFAGFLQNYVVTEAYPGETDSCRPSGAVFHCVRESVEPVAGLIAGLGLWTVAAKATAPIGAEGQVLLKVRVDSGPITTSTSTLRVGMGVSLNAGGSVRRSTPA